MSALARICIERPVFTVMLALSLVVLGLISYTRLGVDSYPNVDFPFAIVSTTLRGASAEEMETSITKPIEEAVNTIEGIDILTSSSREGISIVTIQFKLYKNGDVATQEVRDKVSTILARLPEGTDPPVIQKFDPGAAPILSIAVAGNRDLREITELSDKVVKADIETLQGVGAVDIVGGRKRAINVYVDPVRLAGYNLSTVDVARALQTQNLELPTGRIKSGPREYVLRTMGRVSRVDQIAAIAIKQRGGLPIRIRDVGTVEDGIEEPRTLARLNGQNSLLLVVRKKSGTNTVQVADMVKKRLAELSRTLPSDLSTKVINDQSRYIKASIDTLKEHFLIGAVLVVIVVFLFMADWRSTLIAAAAIPSSIIATYTVMDFLGYTINNMTLLGLLVALGIVIDDAIVILENIFRHMEEHDLPARQAAIEGTAEIALAVMATTFSLVVIFLPIAFMSGIVGRFFNSYGITIATAILFSLLISFTLTPMLCSRFLKLKPRELRRSAKDTLFYKIFDAPYGFLLRWSLRHRWVIVLAATAVVFSTGPLLKFIGKNFLPSEDRSEFELFIQMPEGSSLGETDRVFTDLEHRLRKELRGVTDTQVSVGNPQTGEVNNGTIYMRLVDLSRRKYSQQDVMRDARRILAGYPDLRASVQDVATMGGGGGRGFGAFTMDLRGPDLGKLSEYSNRVADELKKIPGVEDVDTSLAVRNPEVRVNINRDRAADLGVSVADIASTLRTFIAGDTVGKFKEASDLYDIWLKSEDTYVHAPEKLYFLTISNRDNQLIPLGNVATLSEDRGPAEIDRRSRQRQVSIFANLDPSRVSLNTVMVRAREVVNEMDLPVTYQMDFSGQAQALGDTFINFFIAFTLSLIFMYMILASQFESFLHPITILLALPVTIPFGVLSLILLHESLNLFGIFGLFLLFGIVKKNGILQVDYTNTLRKTGMERNAAVLEANHTRLRPILMTTFTLIAAMIPIALGQGPGSMMRSSIAKIIIGGQAMALLLTLLVTPVVYTIFDDLGKTRLFAWLRTRKAAEVKELAGVASASNPHRSP